MLLNCFVFNCSFCHSLALSFQILAVKPIIETLCIVALRITLSVVEVQPALQRGRAVLPRLVEVEGAVAVVPATRVIVAPLVADLVVLSFFTLRDVAGDLHFLWWFDFFARPSQEGVVQDVASEAVEVHRADTMVERRIGDVFTCAAIIAGVGITRAVSGELTLGTSEELRAQTLGSLAARDAGASIAAVDAATCLGVIIAG